jgi:hypothetical protein
VPDAVAAAWIERLRAPGAADAAARIFAAGETLALDAGLAALSA